MSVRSFSYTALLIIDITNKLFNNKWCYFFVQLTFIDMKARTQHYVLKISVRKISVRNFPRALISVRKISVGNFPRALISVRKFPSTQLSVRIFPCGTFLVRIFPRPLSTEFNSPDHLWIFWHCLCLFKVHFASCSSEKEHRCCTKIQINRCF